MLVLNKLTSPRAKRTRACRCACCSEHGVAHDVWRSLEQVGNKSDLVHEREVPHDEGQKLAVEWGVPFIECSAKLNSNIEEIFHKLIAHTEGRSDGADGEKKCAVM